jgi:hypothetical protein
MTKKKINWKHIEKYITSKVKRGLVKTPKAKREGK